MLIERASRITGTEVRYLEEWIGKKEERSRNSQIRGILNQEPFTKIVNRRNWRCFGQLIKMDSNRKPRQVWETRVEGMEGRVTPRIEWEDHVWKLMRKKVKSLLETTRLVKDRKAFQIWLLWPHHKIKTSHQWNFFGGIYKNLVYAEKTWDYIIYERMNKSVAAGTLNCFAEQDKELNAV